jgi:Uma2 family endonuclease
MAEPASLPRMTVAEFVDWDDGAEVRHELVHGVPVTMAPPSGWHAEITGNVSPILSRQLARPCRVPQGGGVARADAEDEFRLPDVFVTCAPTPERYFRAPRLVVEVLSPSTEKDDRTDKLDFYRSLPLVEAVLLIWHEHRRAQLQLRDEGRWIIRDLIGVGTLEVPGLGVGLSLDEIYQRLDVLAEPGAGRSP